MKQEITKEVAVPEDISIEIDGNTVNVKGPKGELKREFVYGNIRLKKEDGKIVLHAGKATKRERKMIGTTAAHIKNMIIGVKERFEYKLQICSVHFPMSIQVDAANKQIIIKNFLGEVRERTAKIPDNVDVKLDGDIITVTAADKKTAGQTAANIERATKIRKRDKRVFQDGIYIIEKAGKRL